MTTRHFQSKSRFAAPRKKITVIKGSIEPVHGSICSDVRKLQSMDALKLQSTRADWNTKCPFHILAYVSVNSNWVHLPPGQPPGISSKNLPGGSGFDF